jgi:hypothetical protein
MPEYTSLVSFADALGQHAISGNCKSLVGHIHTAVHRTLKEALIRHSPVGGDKDKHAGLLKGSWISDPPDSAIKAGTESTMINRAPHMTIINRGRLVGKTTTRMLGSIQAPRGVTRPSFGELGAKTEAIISEAIAQAESEAS